MRAGSLDTRVTIESRVLSQDTLGAPVETWSTFRTMWAEVTDQRGLEVAAGRLMQTQAVRQTIVRMRYVAGLTPLMRLRFGGRTMDIKAISQRGRKAYHDIVCEDTNG
jgi:SPP1 family predicted phage head-tail adaptor